MEDKQGGAYGQVESLLRILRRKRGFVSFRLKWEHSTKLGLQWDAGA